MKPWMIYALCVVGGLAGGIVIAKYTMPPKTITRVETKTETVEVVKWKDREVMVEGPVRETTKTVTVPGPAGPTVTVEKVVEREKIVTIHDNSGTSQINQDVETKTEKVVDARSWLAVEAGIGIGIPSGNVAYTGSVQMRLFGIWAGPSFIKADTWYPGATVRWEF